MLQDGDFSDRVDRLANRIIIHSPKRRPEGDMPGKECPGIKRKPVGRKEQRPRTVLAVEDVVVDAYRQEETILPGEEIRNNPLFGGGPPAYSEPRREEQPVRLLPAFR